MGGDMGLCEYWGGGDGAVANCGLGNANPSFDAEADVGVVVALVTRMGGACNLNGDAVVLLA